MIEQKLLLETRPSWWNFFWHFVFFFFLIPIIVALWQRAALIMRVYGDRVTLEKGVLSKNVKEVFISDIRAIDVNRSLLQRIFRIGDVMIATAGTAGYEDVAHGLPDPLGVKNLVMGQRQKITGSND
jgi:uncharacterized membrane protein YdbT with pleckstrin-like domain